MRDARLVVFRRDHPHVVGNGARDLLAHVEPFRVDAVVIGDQDAQRGLFVREIEVARMASGE